MVNTQLIDRVINNSGYKVNFLCEKMGITRSAFFLKKNNKRPFKTAEIYVLSDLLHLSDEDKQNIFFA